MNVPAVLIGFLTVFAVISAVVLARAAFLKPRIGALTERAVIGALLAFFGVVYTVVALDTELGRVVLTTDLARFVVRCAVVAILSIPTYWTFLYLTGRLGSAVCAVTTEAWGRCSIAGATVVRVSATDREDLILPLCPTHAAILAIAGASDG